MELKRCESTLSKRRVISVVGDVNNDLLLQVLATLSCKYSKEVRKSVMDDLNDDVLVQVLVRLPCKSVVQFKCVCKRWMSLISNPSFVPNFLNHHNSIASSPSKLPHQQCWRFIALVPTVTWGGETNVRFLAGRGHKVELPLFKPDLPFLPKVNYDETENRQNNICVLGCFKDLILCSRGFPNPSVYYICNPITMQFLTLPPPPHVHEIGCIGFVCEPLSMYPNHRFRVVRISLDICTFRFPLSPELEIFSSETGLWSKKTLAVSYPTGMTPQFYQGVKLVSFENGQMILFTGEYIIKFDPLSSGSQIKGQYMKLPDEFSRGRRRGSDRSVVISQGRLFLLRISVLCDRWHYRNIITIPQIMIWKECNDNVKKDGESEWMLIHDLQFKEMKAVQKGAVTPLVGRISAEEYERMYTRSASPHSRKHRGTWLGNFLKGLMDSCYRHELTHEVVFVGFDLDCSYTMYLMLCPPQPALAAFAAYNMRTREIKLLHRSKVPLHLRYLSGYGYDRIRNHRIFPFVPQPWPTPIPQSSP